MNLPNNLKFIYFLVGGFEIRCPSMRHLTLEGDAEAVIKILGKIKSSAIEEIDISFLSRTVFSTIAALPEIAVLFSGGNQDISMPKIIVRLTLPAEKMELGGHSIFVYAAQMIFREKGIEDRLEWSIFIYLYFVRVHNYKTTIYRRFIYILRVDLYWVCSRMP